MLKQVLSLSVLFSAMLLSAQSILAIPLNSHSSENQIVLVEYYDYECPHCRDMQSVIEALQTHYPELKIIYRPTPLLTDQSQAIAKLVLASEKQSHTLQLDKALLTLNHAPSLEEVLSLSQQRGFNTQALINASQQPDIEKQLKYNISLAETHAINGEIYLPILTMGNVDDIEPRFTLTGEQSYALLSAIIQQLEQNHVQLVKQKKEYHARGARAE